MQVVTPTVMTHLARMLVLPGPWPVGDAWDSDGFSADVSDTCSKKRRRGGNQELWCNP